MLKISSCRTISRSAGIISAPKYSSCFLQACKFLEIFDFGDFCWERHKTFGNPLLWSHGLHMAGEIIHPGVCYQGSRIIYSFFIQDYLLYFLLLLFIYYLFSNRTGSWTCVQSLALLQLFLQLYNVKINTHHMGTQGRLIH